MEKNPGKFKFVLWSIVSFEIQYTTFSKRMKAHLLSLRQVNQ